MLSIGEFARHGGVSLRVLRHYDTIELLRPEWVDPASGYRWYAAGQLQQLNRIVALRDLGFGLERIQELTSDGVGVEELREMLIRRRTELEDAVAEESSRLARVEARLRSLDAVGQPATEVVIRALPAASLVELADEAASFTPEDIGPVIGPLCARLGELLSASRLRPVGHLTAYYERTPAPEDRVGVHAGVAVEGDGPVPAALTGVLLPRAETAATIVHRGGMDEVLTPLGVLARWIDESGHEPCGFPREIYLETGPDESRWVTELQQPVRVVSSVRGPSSATPGVRAVED